MMLVTALIVGMGLAYVGLDRLAERVRRRSYVRVGVLPPKGERTFKVIKGDKK